MHDDAAQVARFYGFRQVQQRSCRGWIDRSRCFCLHQEKALGSGGHQKIDFESTLVPEEIQLATSAEIDLTLDDLGGDVAFEDRPQKWRASQLPLGLDAEEMARKA